MRISDWSSDVCSSDLGLCLWRVRQDRRARRIGGGTVPAGQGTRRAVSRIAARAWHQRCDHAGNRRSEEHTSELQSLMRISYAVICLKKKKTKYNNVFYY